jgi:hypothetical protein
MSTLLAPLALILINLDIIELMRVIVLRGFPLLLRGGAMRFPLCLEEGWRIIWKSGN